MLVDLAYSREFEIEADRYALDAMTEAGVDLIHFRNIMQKLEDWYDEQDQNANSLPEVLKYLKTHPDTNERIAMIEAYRG